MKYRIILLALVCLGLACQAQNRVDKQGRRQGHWIKTDKDGSKIFEGDFVDGLETGTFTYYYPDGTLKIRNIFTTPGKYCSHEAYDEKGHLLAKGYYSQHNRDGQWTFYNEDGKVVKQASYRMGVKEGVHIVFTSKGDTAEVTTWKDNHREGRWWKRVGEKGWITANYAGGMMQGRLAEYDDNGRLCREGWYKDGQKDGSYRYYENGSKTVDEAWKKGVLGDRKILIHVPQDQWVSIYAISYFMPKGSMGTMLYTNDGKKYSCRESIEELNGRVGQEQFVTVDKRNRVTANLSAINGLKASGDGRMILDLSPEPPFVIFPDDDCVKLIKSLKRIDELDQ
ncbi:MAG: hypothetical protein K5864_05800 [Bacteroidales bacterium]|nr:hypothetical protein [Bacteroidales bacterium]